MDFCAELRPLDIVRLERLLHAAGLSRRVIYVPRVDSTNRIARELPPETPGGTAVITDYQERGRGRLGRGWAAPPRSSVLLSVLLYAPNPICATDIVMVGALAVADAIGTVCGVCTEIKWPNDVQVKGRKVSGILAEQSTPAGRIVLGIGINCNVDREGVETIPPSATVLEREVKTPVDREKLIAGLFMTLGMWYRDLTRNRDDVFREWASRLVTLGRPVDIMDAAGTWSGMAIGVQPDGALRVRDLKGTVRTVYAADVSVRQVESTGD